MYFLFECFVVAFTVVIFVPFKSIYLITCSVLDFARFHTIKSVKNVYYNLNGNTYSNNRQVHSKTILCNINKQILRT